MNAALQNAKGPAEAATSPDHGSNIPPKEFEMNEQSNSTADARSPMEEIRRLQKELSHRLAEHNDGRWFAMTMPAGEPYPQLLGVWPQGSAADELPIDRITRLSHELSDALNDWLDGRFMAMVLPSSRGGRTVMFQNTDAHA